MIAATQQRNKWKVVVQQQPWNEPTVHHYRTEEIARECFYGFQVGAVPAWIELLDPSGKRIVFDTNEKYWR